jgi:erythromycin esterase-like protein
MQATTDATMSDAIRSAVHPLDELVPNYDPLFRLIGDARFVLLGEASHGTHEFYRERARITKRLIEEGGLSAVAIEGDWPDAARVNRYVRGIDDDPDATEALADFRRFPQWMWRNTEVVEFIEWLRLYNESRPAQAPKVGFYGLDLYSLRASMDAVLRYLGKADPQAAARARARYACFDQFGDDTRAYGFLAGTGLAEGCTKQAVEQFTELLQRVAVDDDFFGAAQNARLVKNAETYYRTMFVGDVPSWNLRDRHMVETLEAVVKHLEGRWNTVKVAVWAHNSHLGDARATEMGQRGELNVGQLVREKHGREAMLIGFTTHHGTVTAASDWDAPAERKNVRPALLGSYEASFHAARIPRFLLPLGDNERLPSRLRGARLERAIGVIYRPQTERGSHYFHARLADQFDAVLHFDETQAVDPLERTAEWEAGEVPETYPFAV